MRHDGSMKRRFSLVVLVGVWVGLVLVSTTAVWWAISHAGSRVTSLAAPQLPTITTTSGPTPTASAPTSPRSSATPSPAPASIRSSKPRSTPRPTAARTTHAPTTVAVQRSWNGTAGRVTATCRGQRITLNAAVPSDGYTVEIEGRGPETLEVEFHANGGENETKIRGACRAGEPQFSVERD